MSKAEQEIVTQIAETLPRVPNTALTAPPDGHYRDGNSRVRASQYEAEEAVRTILRYIGEDIDREGLRDTPKRVIKAWREMTSGYCNLQIHDILSPIFKEAFDELITLKGIPFCSTCEHHLLPFTGFVDVGYIPGKDLGCNSSPNIYKVVGLSKLARLVDYYSRRLSLQERLTRQVAEAVNEVLKPEGVGVIVRASHQCISCRGVSKPGVECVTSTLLGVFRHNPAARNEFLSLCK